MGDAHELQFERAEFDQAPAAAVCGMCATPLHSSYFLINDAMACESCRYRVETPDSGSGIGRFIRASGAGVAAAIAGAVLYYAIAAMTGYEFGLIAIVVGLGVGGAVKWGSRGRGGWRYQALAMMLTYLSIVGTYIPPIIESIRQQPDGAEAGAPAVAGESTAGGPAADTAAADANAAPPTLGTFVMALAVLMAIACAAPFLAGVQNLMGIVIIGIGLYEAWKINRHVPQTISGPHAIGAAPASIG